MNLSSNYDTEKEDEKNKEYKGDMVMWRWRSKKEEGSAKDERHTQLLQKQQQGA